MHIGLDWPRPASSPGRAGRRTLDVHWQNALYAWVESQECREAVAFPPLVRPPNWRPHVSVQDVIKQTLGLAEFGLRYLVFAPVLGLTLLEHEQHELYTKPLSDVRIREKRGSSKSAFLAAPEP